MFKLKPIREMKMSAHPCSNTILLIAFAAISGVVHAQEDHEKKAEEHLEMALKSGKGATRKA